MLRIHPSENATAAKQYYKAGLSTSDYYVEKGVAKGYWGGEAAKLLGLSGAVEPEQFDRLVDNLHPFTEEKLTPRVKKSRRSGYDFTFNAPKSVSVVYALSNFETRKTIRTAFEVAMVQTTYQMEQFMHTRVRKGGADFDRKTSNMVWARFTHDTSRPMDDGIPDPHLHAHCYVMNLTRDKSEDRWKAGQFGQIKNSAPYFEAVFHNHFAGMLKLQGFGITPTRNRWEIAGISQKVIRNFSRRTKQINDLADFENLSERDKARLAAKTRNSKTITESASEIQNNWFRRYTASGGGDMDKLRDKQGHSPSLDQVMDHTISHLFERQSTVTTEQAMTTALRFSVGEFEQEEIYSALYERGALFKTIKGTEYLTMPHVLKEEQDLLGQVRGGRGTRKALISGAYDLKADFLNDQQKAAVKHILTSKDQVIAVQGRAGTGKTTTMKEVKVQLSRSGKRLYAFAPSADAARSTLREEGFTGAETVARLLVDKKLQANIKNQVIWMDEAGQVGIRTMRAFLKIAKEQNARVILSGDIKQHGAVERGDAFRLMQKNAGMKVITMDHIVRQKWSLYRQVVEFIQTNKLSKAMKNLNEMKAFHEIEDDKERYQAIAEDYFQSMKEGQSVLVVSPTNYESTQVTGTIRERLKMAQIVRGREVERTRLVPLHYSDAEKNNTGHYIPGQVLQLTQNMDGLLRGEQLAVLKNDDPKHLLLKRLKNDQLVSLPIEKSKHVEVFNREKIHLAKGDQIRITRNGFTKYGHDRLNNGSHYTIDRVKSNGDLVLNNGFVLSDEFKHMQYGYVSTSYASQSKTVDHVIIAQSSHSFGKASTQEQFYVSVSRGRHKIGVYTDDVKGLKNQLNKSSQRMTATELMGEAKHSGWFGNMKQSLNHYRHKVASYVKTHLPAVSRTQPS